VRNTFINELHKLAAKDPNIFLVVGDLGYSVVEKFAAELPNQYLNAGVAEQNMTGLAAGLSLASARNVFTYSIANFPTLRCFEQIRNDVCYHNANVKVVSVGSGLAYGTQGYTHYGVEDVGVMRTLPNMVIASPCDPLEATALAHMAATTYGPWYVRLGKNKEPHLHAGVPVLKIGEPIEIKSGRDGVILASGPITLEAVNAAKALAPDLDVSVMSVPFLKPLSEAAIVRLAKQFPWMMTVEEHSQVGGLFSAVSDILVRAQLPQMPKIRGIYLPEKLDKLGEQEFLRKHYGIDSSAIVNIAKAI
jgi:transketolase